MSEESDPTIMPGKTGCRQLELELAAYLEGEDRPAVSAHARECPRCHAILADLEMIHNACRKLPLEEPPANLWAKVRSALAQERIFYERAGAWQRRFRLFDFLPKPAPVAALAVLTILAAILLVSPRAFNRTVSSRGPAARVAAVEEMPPYLNEENNLARAVKEMEKSYQAGQTSLDPAVKAVYEKGLESLDTSIDECRASVRQEPANNLAHEYLLTAYAQKAEVLAAALQFEGR